MNSIPSIKGNFTEHTRNVLGTLRDGEPVASPAVWHLLDLGGRGSKLEIGDLRVASEDDGASSRVLVHESDGVGGGKGGHGSGSEDDLAEETHFCCWFFF